MDDPPFEPDHYPPGEWTPWTQTGAEAWRMVGCMAGAVIRVELFTATGYSMKTEFRWIHLWRDPANGQYGLRQIGRPLTRL